MTAGANPEALARLEPVRLLFAELRRSEPEEIESELYETAATSAHVARVFDRSGDSNGDTVSATHTTPEGAVEVLGGIVRAMAEKRHADLAKALDAFDASGPGADHKKTPRSTGRGRK